MINALLWLGGVVTVALACNLKDPMLLPLRAWETGGLLAFGLAGCALVLRRRPRLGIPCAGLWLAGSLIAVAGEAQFQARRHAVLRAESSTLGRHFILGYDQVQTIAPLAARGLVGGIFVTRRNVEGRTAEEIRQEIAGLQELRRTAGLPPLIVATDQEGGMVSRLSPPLSALPSLAAIATLPIDRRAAAARDHGAIHGRELASLGITVNFAPVVDLRVDRPRNPFDRHSLIARRAIADDPAVVTEVALAYAQALDGAGVTPTLKHFPGLGSIADDTHYFRARLDTPPGRLAARDWIPFRAVATHAPAFLMLGHVALTAIDPERAASHSRRVAQDLLRETWGFEGVLITDDLAMGAIHRHGPCIAVVEALNAGIDLLLIAYDADQYFPLMTCALAAERDGRIDLAMLARSARRLEIDRQRRLR